MRRFLALILLILPYSTIIAQEAPSTTGTRFWLAFMENLSLVFNGTPDFGIVVSSAEDANLSISVPATGLSMQYSIAAGSIEEIMLPEAIWYSQVSEVIEGKGILIESDVPVEVSVYHYRLFFSDAAKLLPESQLEHEYIVMAVKDLNGNTPSTLVIAATEDATEVEITPTVLTQGLRPPGIPFTITLNEGEIYQIHASNDLTGTRVRALNGEKLAVFSGSQQADVYCITDDSHHWEQTPPSSMLGTRYFLVPYLTQGGDEFKVMATQDSTTIVLNCEVLTTLNSGESSLFFLDEPARLDATSPVMLAQLNTSGDCNPEPGGPSFSILHPFELRTGSAAWYASMTLSGPYDEMLFNRHFVNVIVETQFSSGVLLNGNPIDFSGFPNQAELSFAALEVPAGNHRLESEQPVWAQVYGFNQAEAYTFALGFNERVPFQSVDLVVAGASSDTICAGTPAFFSYSFGTALSNWEWNFGDGSSSQSEFPDYTFNGSGVYSISFTATDDLGCLYDGSTVIEVEDCSVGLSEEQLLSELFWSPDDNRLVISTQKAVNSLGIYDLSGRVLIEAQLQKGSSTLDLSFLASGIYIARVNHGLSGRSLKILKQ